MKKILIISIIGLLSFGACEVTDVDPKGDIPQDIAFSDEASVKSAIVGCYDALQSTGYYGRYYTVVPDLLANNLDENGTTQEYAEFSNNAVQSDNFVIEGIWNRLYDGINRANMVIVNISDAGLNDDDENMYLAHAYFIRALNHFNLMRFFGEIPVKTTPSTEPGDHLNVPRNSIDEVYEQIFTDLEKAHANITSIFTGSADFATVKALLARVHLYRQNWTEAKTYAGQVINDFNYMLEPAFGDLFPAENSSESIFEIHYTEQDNNLLAQYFLPTAIGGRHEFIPTDSLLAAYAEADSIRVRNSITEDSDGLYCNKYTELATRSDNVYVFRLAEMYLIRAEAEAQLNGDIETIQNDINAVRNRAGLNDTEADNYNDLLNVVLEERRREFAFEGHYWFDLVRNGKAMEQLENVTTTDQYLMPIPLSEMQTNDAMTQNSGY